jgi:AbrB family looped-hinge helix DNA binding protein
MNKKHYYNQQGGSMAISKVGQRRQVVIPKDLCDDLGISEGDFVEVTKTTAGVLIKPKKLVDRDDVLTPEEAALVRKGERQIARGDFVTLDKIEHDLDNKARKRSRKTA